MDKEKGLEAIEEKGQSENSGGDMLAKYQNELRKIGQKGRVDTNKIKVVEITDHKNISLWTKDGKRIGPMHPHNARRTFGLFWDIGIQLSADQPTQTQITAYKKTKEYKAKQKLHEEKRAIKDKSRRAGQMERLAKQIAKMSGMQVDAINSILKARDIKPLSEGPDRVGRAVE